MVLGSMGVERKAEQSLASKLREIGPSRAVSRFLQKHVNIMVEPQMLLYGFDGYREKQAARPI